MPRIKHIEYGFIEEPKALTRPLYKQVHGNRLIEVTDTNLASLYHTPPEADGAFTFQSGIKLSVFTADCLPILFYTDDPNGPIATVHCGWRGALHKIVESFEDLWGDFRNQINVILGPCLEPCCFEVKDDFITAFKNEGLNISKYLIPREQQLFFHLSEFVIKEQLGFIANNRIMKDDLRCTYCSLPSLPSYRRNKSTDPRIRGWICKTN